MFVFVRWSGLAAAVFVSGLTTVAWGEGVAFKTVALSGGGVPAIAEGVQWEGFSGAPSLNNAGQLAFMASVEGRGINNHSNNLAIVRAGMAGDVDIVARRGEVAPVGVSGVIFNIINNQVAINNSGEVAFFSLVNSSNAQFQNRTGLFSEVDGSLGSVAVPWGQAPSVAPGIDLRVSAGTPVLSEQGGGVFRASLIGGGVTSSNNLALYTEDGGGARLIARTGDIAPGATQIPGLPSLGPAFERFSGLGVSHLGDVIFTGSWGSASDGIFAHRGGELRQLVRERQFMTGRNDNLFVFDINHSTSNRNGQAAFTARVGGPDIDAENNHVVLVEASDLSGEFREVARKGAAAPGVSSGITFDGFESVVLNNEGGVVFVGALAGDGVVDTNNSGLFVEANGVSQTLSLLAREGEQAAGVEADVHYARLHSAMLNDLGHTVFLADLAGEGVGDTNDQAIFATDLDGVVHLLAREGDLFDVDDTANESLHSIRTLGIAIGDTAGVPRGLNDAGQVAIKLSFSGSSGIFLTTLPVPEPGTAVLMAGGLWGLLRRR